MKKLAYIAQLEVILVAFPFVDRRAAGFGCSATEDAPPSMRERVAPIWNSSAAGPESFARGPDRAIHVPSRYTFASPFESFCLRRNKMDEETFEGTLVLEQLAEAGELDEFMEAVDADDLDRAVLLMRRANVDAETIAIVLAKMADPDGEH